MIFSDYDPRTNSKRGKRIRMHQLVCNGYQNTDKVICMTATGDNNFLNEGIVEGTLLFVDTNGEYQKGQLNVFKYKAERTPQYKLSRRRVPQAAFVGKVLMAVNQY